MSTCELCGRSADSHERDIRFRLPDAVLALPEQEHTVGTSISDEDPARAVMMLVPELGGFVRALLPVRLTGGYTVTFGVWVGIHPDELRRTAEVWWAPEYTDLHLQGRLANALPTWQVLGAPVSLAVTDPDSTPYCVDSEDDELRAVLATEWDHEPVLAALPD